VNTNDELRGLGNWEETWQPSIEDDTEILPEERDRTFMQQQATQSELHLNANYDFPSDFEFNGY